MKQFPGPLLPLVNMAEELLETVERLQSRLSESQEPRKLLKTLKRLAELPMTVDILVETGIGKTVNSLRKHDLVGETAKTVVAKWKKLVPQSADRLSATKDVRTHSQAMDPNRSHKRPQKPSPEDLGHVDEEEEEEEEQHEEYEHHDPEEEDDDDEQVQMNRYHHDYSPSPPQAYSPTAPGLTGQRLPQYQRTYDRSPEEEPAPSPPRRESHHGKAHRDSARDYKERSRELHSGLQQEHQRKRAHQTTSSSGGSEGKKGSHREQSSSGVGGGGSSNAHRQEKHKNTHTSSHERKHTHENRKEKKGGSSERSHLKREASESQEESEVFEAPTMSFESFLTYDAPTPVKKKKKQQTPQPSPSKPSSKPSAPIAAPASAPKQSSKSSTTNGARSSKRSEPSQTPTSTPVTPTQEKRKKVVDVMPTLPDIPLPAIQPNYRPLPSIEHTPMSPQRRKVPVSYDEEDSGFTGRRFNSKMVVYSGSKTSYLPKMMTLYQQCIRVLQNNIDSIDEVGGVPFEILEPVLERCTPEQLYRIEECNQHFLEDTDELWTKHCQRDFKREAPQEYESWRELYLRLHDEREERLRMLTQNISSAHANRPKARTLKMAYVNSVVKPPRDVRRRQEKFGTKSGASSSSSAPSTAVRIKPAMAYSAPPFSDDSGQSSYSSAPEPSRPSVSGGGGHSAREKPQVKKIAPMMAKTIKAFKNRFSRR